MSSTPKVSPETHQATRAAVRNLLESSDSFHQLSPDKRQALAHNLVQIGSYLAEPDGVRLKPDQQSQAVQALADTPLSGRRTAKAGSNTSEDGKFTAQGAREGAAVAGALLEAVNFPDFVSGLIDGVFHSIVKSSIEQMEAYANLVSEVSKSLNQFRDENVTQNQGRDQLVEQYPDLFELSMDTGDFGFGDEGKSSGPRVKLREGVNEKAALERVNSLPIEGGPLTKLDDETVDGKLVSAARTQIATSRQQLLATMVMMGINRIVVTDGKIQAKVMYEFKAKDNMQFRKSAQSFDYGDQYAYTSDGSYESERQGGESNYTRNKDGSAEGSRRGASYYAKGTYKSTATPMLTAASASQTSLNASLETKASLMGNVEVNFKSDYLPLEKMATPENIAAIQMNAKPGMAKTAASRPAAPAAAPAPTAPAP